jgi:3-isopropylmalate dehydrogenase
MARHTITLIPGDGVGPEVSDAARRVIDATGVGIDWEVHDAGLGVMEQYGDPLPPHVLDSIRRNKVAIKGPLTTPVGKGIRSVNVALRRELDLYALVRPCKSYPGVRSRYQDVDLVIVRENNEGFQPDRNVVAGSGEFRPTHDVTISVRVITRNGSSKVAREAFELARTRDKRLTVVHKDTVFKLGCGMFVEECKRVAAEFPDVRMDEAIVDTFAMRLVMTPQRYDVVVTTNMFGDILSDEAAGLVGGLGLAPGLSAGPQKAMAQATHGSAPDIAGRNIANPYAMIVSGQMLLAWLGRKHRETTATDAARRISAAVEKVMMERKSLTPDLGGTASTSEMGDAIVAALV